MNAPTDAGLSTDRRSNCLTGPTVEWSHACRSCSVSFGHGIVCWDTSNATVENTLTPAVNDAMSGIDGAWRPTVLRGRLRLSGWLIGHQTVRPASAVCSGPSRQGEG